MAGETARLVAEIPVDDGEVVRLTRDLGLNPAGVEVVLRLTDELHTLRRELAARREEDQ